jgi:hypothetical protein
MLISIVTGLAVLLLKDLLDDLLLKLHKSRPAQSSYKQLKKKRPQKKIAP